MLYVPGESAGNGIPPTSVCLCFFPIPGAPPETADPVAYYSTACRRAGETLLNRPKESIREKEPRRNENRREGHSDSNEPKEGIWKHCSVRKYLANQRKNHDDARVGVPGAKEILAQRVLL